MVRHCTLVKGRQVGRKEGRWEGGGGVGGWVVARTCLKTWRFRVVSHPRIPRCTTPLSLTPVSKFEWRGLKLSTGPVPVGARFDS